MAVRARDRRAGRGAHMGEIEVRADVAAEIAQVLVRPGRAHLAIEAGLRMLAVPAEAEAVTVGGGGRFQRLDALHDQRMSGRGDVLFERDGLPAIGDPSAHSASCTPIPKRGFNIPGGEGKHWQNTLFQAVARACTDWSTVRGSNRALASVARRPSGSAQALHTSLRRAIDHLNSGKNGVLSMMLCGFMSKPAHIVTAAPMNRACWPCRR